MTPGPCRPLCLIRYDSLPGMLKLMYLPAALSSLFTLFLLLSLLGLCHHTVAQQAILEAPWKPCLQVSAHLPSHSTLPMLYLKKAG